MTDTVEFGDPIPHDGSDECPEHARDVRCSVRIVNQWWHSARGVNGREHPWTNVDEYRLPADHPFYAENAARREKALTELAQAGQEMDHPAEEPTCGACWWWNRYDSDFALPGQGRCHYNPATPDGFGLCFEDSMACRKFTAKGASQ